MADSTTIVWLRQDLRLADNPALHAAAQRGGPVAVVYVLADEEEGDWPAGGASRWWLHHSLQRLDASLRRRRSRLVLRRGRSLPELLGLAREAGAGAVYWNRRYEPAAVARDEAVAAGLRRAGLEVSTFGGSLLVEPWDVSTGAGDPYRVFTPYWRACQRELEVGPPLPVPRLRSRAGPAPASLSLDASGLLPAADWAAGLRAAWQPGEEGAAARLATFLGRAAGGAAAADAAHPPSACGGRTADGAPATARRPAALAGGSAGSRSPGEDSPLATYGEARDLPARDGTSALSPHLHFGEISPRQVWRAVADAGLGEAAGPWLRQLGWREFAHHLLYHYPHTPAEPLRPEFAGFPWRRDPAALRAWQRGRTGYPVVDAGMRQLWRTGWMHNRVRMAAASFLVKDLLLPWQEGARWFWDTLVDADLANNTLGWQWTAGCGADAAPFFRVFNPVSQGRKFDPEGAYVRRWIPELARVPARWIHAPWEAPAAVLADAGVGLGRTYPKPIVDHPEARARALAAFRRSA